jgi:hypothetical protein
MSKSKPSQDIITKKFILELNEALAFENAGIERIQTRIEEISIPEAKQVHSSKSRIAITIIS